MVDRTTESEVTFKNSCLLSCLVTPLQAGTYRLVVDEELIQGLSFPAYKRVGAHLEIPAISIATGKRQLLQVSLSEIAHALLRDADTSAGYSH